MNELQRKAITKMYATLRRSLDPDPLLAELLSAELVTFDQFEDISSLSKTPEKNSRILQLIMNHGGCETFGKFCDCIEKADSAQKFLANELKAAFISVQQESPVCSTVPSQESEGACQSPQHEQEGGSSVRLREKPSQLHLMHYVSKKLTTSALLKQFTLFIGLDSHDYEAALSDNPNKIGGAALASLMIWYKGKGKPREWKTLTDAFRFVDMVDYAAELEEKIQSGQLIQ